MTGQSSQAVTTDGRIRNSAADLAFAAGQLWVLVCEKIRVYVPFRRCAHGAVDPWKNPHFRTHLAFGSPTAPGSIVHRWYLARAIRRRTAPRYHWRIRMEIHRLFDQPNRRNKVGNTLLTPLELLSALVRRCPAWLTHPKVNKQTPVVLDSEITHSQRSRRRHGLSERKKNPGLEQRGGGTGALK